MTPTTVRVGSILIGDLSHHISDVLTLESEPYFGCWRVIRPLDALTLDTKLHAAHWNFFFLAAEVKVMFFGALGAANIREAVKRILRRVRPENFNCLEVTDIVAKRFWGIPTLPSSRIRGISSRAANLRTWPNGERASETQYGLEVDSNETRDQERMEPMFTKVIKWSAIAALIGGVLSRSVPGIGLVLQFAVVAAAVVVLTQAATMRRYVWMSFFIVVACLFNPVVPIPFTNYSFGIAAGFAAILFFLSVELLKTSPKLSIASITDRMPGSESL